jgi:hypothetical protein
VTTIIANTSELAIVNTQERINIRVFDDSVSPEVLVDATAPGPRLTVQDLGSNIVYKDAFPVFTLTGTVSVTAGQTLVTGTNTRFTEEVRVGDSLTFGGETRVVESISGATSLVLTAAHTAGATGAQATKPTRIVREGVGRYYIEWGDVAAPGGDTETAMPGLFGFLWQASAPGQEQQSVVQNLCVATVNTLAFLPPFRDLIDKCRKAVDDESCFLGYTDTQLLQYLDQGLSIINAYEPYPVFNSLDQFPRQFLYVLLESSLIAGVMSQQLFAIDTDIPQYSDQGNTFVIQHAPQLANVLNQVTARLDKLIPRMKYKFVQTGSLHIQAGTNFRIAQLISSAPNGALFRNIFFRGS